MLLSQLDWAKVMKWAKNLGQMLSLLEQLLLETDSPDQPGAAHRGERNEPAYLGEVLEVVAGLRGMAADTLANATSANAQRLFGLPASA